MPIEGISDIVRLPRLGKIHLGQKVETPGKNPYPRATDHFVCPPEVQEVFGEKPKELRIMFPTDDPNEFTQQWLRAYTLTQGLVCIGNGLNCRRKVDLVTGNMASHTTEKWEWKADLTCDSQNCPEYLAKRCRRVMNLQFLLLEVPGLGVWQIDTSSFYSILNINNMVKLLRALLGRCRLIPLTLALGPVEVSPPGQKKKTVYIMHIKKDVRLTDLARLAQLPPARLLLPEPEVEEPPEDLFPQEVLEGEADGAPPPPDERGGCWKEMLDSLAATQTPRTSLVAWFKKNFGITISQAEANAETPPQAATLEMIEKLRDNLRTYQARLAGLDPLARGGL